MTAERQQIKRRSPETRILKRDLLLRSGSWLSSGMRGSTNGVAVNVWGGARQRRCMPGSESAARGNTRVPVPSRSAPGCILTLLRNEGTSGPSAQKLSRSPSQSRRLDFSSELRAGHSWSSPSVDHDLIKAACLSSFMYCELLKSCMLAAFPLCTWLQQCSPPDSA